MLMVNQGDGCTDVHCKSFKLSRILKMLYNKTLKKERGGTGRLYQHGIA